MRILSLIVIIAVLAGAGYFFMNMSSYEPTTGTRIQELPEQNVDDLVIEEKAPETPVEQEQVVTEETRTLVQNAYDKYMAYRANLPRQAQKTMTDLVVLMAKGKLPFYFLGVDPAAQLHSFEPISFDPFNASHLRLTQGRIKCDDVEGSSGQNVKARYTKAVDSNGKARYQCVDNQCPRHEYYDVMVGDILANKFLCDPLLEPLSGDRIYLGGPGEDMVKHTKGNSITDGGTGNDVMSLGKGRHIMVLSQGWGQDKITLDCEGATINKNQIETFPLPWNYDFANFLVFGEGIRPEDLVFNGLEIEHNITKDKVTFNDYCFNIVFAEEFEKSGIPDKID